MTAENPTHPPTTFPRWSGFNEAAADDRGKPTRTSSPAATGGSSFNEAAADDRGKPPRRRRRSGASSCFNEAAADDRGKRPAPRPASRPAAARRFNEAAADDRGKQIAEGDRGLAAQEASMRPRPMTAENLTCISDGKPLALLQ